MDNVRCELDMRKMVRKRKKFDVIAATTIAWFISTDKLSTLFITGSCDRVNREERLEHFSQVVLRNISNENVFCPPK